MKRFTELDEGFVCEKCHKEVKPLHYSSRDHCPYCLYSKHVDVMPGDRQNSCKGDLVPINVLQTSKKGQVIIYKCAKCNKEVRNIVANDDNMDLIINLSVQK